MNYEGFNGPSFNYIPIDKSLNNFSESAEKNGRIDNSIIKKNEDEKRRHSENLSSIIDGMKIQMSKGATPNQSKNYFQAYSSKNINSQNYISSISNNNMINSMCSDPLSSQINNSNTNLVNSFYSNPFSLTKIPTNSTMLTYVNDSLIKTSNSGEIIVNPNINQYYSKSSLPISTNKKIQNEQEKRDAMNKSLIIERHSIELSNYYEYPQEEKDNHIIQLLKDINYFGEISKKEIQKDKDIKKNKYISIEEAFQTNKDKIDDNGYKNELCVLALLGKALQSQGCSVLIEKNYPENLEQNKEINTAIQFLANGMYNFIKYIFYFDLGEEISNKLLSDLNARYNFNFHLRIKLIQIFNLKENDIIMTNIRFYPYSITAIIKKDKFNQCSPDDLFQYLINDIKFNSIKLVEKSILLSGCKLNPYMLDKRGNNKDGGWGINEMRGGAPYYPPNGWVGYGIRIVDRFDNGDNSWIAYNNSNGEWSVAYHGIGNGRLGTHLNSKKIQANIFNGNISIPGIKNQFKDYKDLFHLGQKVGEGIIVTPKPEIMEQNCDIFDCFGKKYKIGFMTRVMPKTIRCAEKQDDYWVINGTDNEIRPYRILIKEL